jgi:hypothetical protein
MQVELCEQILDNLDRARQRLKDNLRELDFIGYENEEIPYLIRELFVYFDDVHYNLHILIKSLRDLVTLNQSEEKENDTNTNT